MKITQILFKQHIGWHAYKNWHRQARRKPLPTNSLEILKKKGIQVIEAEDILKEKRTFERVEVVGFQEKPVAFDETHPDWHNEPLLHYQDGNVLLEGLNQAKALTNTVELQEGLPKQDLPEIPKNVDTFARQIVRSSQIFDAEQKKLPKVKDPLRPYFNLPRVYGISLNRRNDIIISKFLQLIETTTDQKVVQDKYLFKDLLFSYPFERDGHQVQLQLTSDYCLSSTKPLKPITVESTEEIPGVDLAPLLPTVSIIKENIYRIENIYPINPNISKKYPHTVFAFFNTEDVKNEFEEEVTDTQIQGRSLLKAFTVAASFARQTYGNDTKNLPQPITVQCVQTDSRMFHFGIFQLNTLDLEGPTKNIWYQTPMQYLFEKCCYELGKPVLEGYNNEPLKHLYAFYNNV